MCENLQTMAMSHKGWRAFLTAALLLGCLPRTHAQDAPPAKPALVESDFESNDPAVEWPKGWPRIPASSWETEDGNRFLRITASEPGKTLMLYREIGIPEGTEALELSWRQRVTGLKKGVNSWFDARIMMEFLDGNRQKVGPSPSAPNRGRDTDGWEQRSVKFSVPQGARILKFMPCLFQVESGTFDLDDVVLRPIPKLAQAEDPAYKAQQKLAQNVEARRLKAAALLATHGSLIPNGDLQTDTKGTGTPDHWGRANGNLSYVTEEGNTFLRLQSTAPGTTVMHYRKIDLPPGVQALELSWDWRITDLVPGKQGWFDARHMLKLLDAHGKPVGKQPAAPYTRRSTGGWQSRSSQFLVDTNAVSLEFMPSLFEVVRGTMDLDNLVLKPVPPDALFAKAAAAAAERARLHVEPETAQRENWPPELKVQGNRLVNPAGEEVWLQGVNIASLEWNPRGENVLKSAQIATEQWKANVIRLPVKEEYWFDETVGADYKKLIENVITFVANRGAYVVLDLHRYRAPRQEHLDFWKDAATVYKNHPAVLFDLINEPHGTSWEIWRNGGFVAEKNKQADEDAFLTEIERQNNAQGFLSLGMQAMVDGVRETGARNIVVIGGLDWAYDLSGITNGYAIVDHPEANGVMYASHVYPWKKQWQTKFLGVAELHPILLGEVGADANKMNWMPLEQQEDAETWVPVMLALIQKHRLNWTAWCFHPSASPRMILDWNYTPTPFWGEKVKAAFHGARYEEHGMR